MKTFNLYGQNFTVSDDFEKYNIYRKIYNEAAMITAEEFKSTYMKNIINLDTLITKVPEYAMLLIKNTISKTIQMLVHEEIMTVDEEIFLRKYYYKYFNFEKYYDPILEKYTEITETSDKLNEYREIQKLTRSKWQGGGFGVSGAIKGAMTAGALNIGTDFLRSFGDSSRSRKDKNQINSMKKAVYNDPNTFSTLYKGIYNCTFGAFYGFIDELILNNVIQPVKLNPKECNTILQNTLKYERNPEKVYKNIIECLMMNPYNFEPYKIIMDSDDKNKEIIEMAIYFGFENQVNNILKEKYKKQINYTIDLPETTTDEIFAKISKYVELMNICYMDYSQTINSLIKKLIYKINSKEELELFNLMIKENLSLNCPSLLPDIEEIFNDKLHEYDNQDLTKENLKYNAAYKTIYSTTNHSNDCNFFKTIRSNSVFAFSLNGEKFAYINDNEEKLTEEILVFDSSINTLSNVLEYEKEYSESTIFITFSENMDYIFSVTDSGNILKWDLKLSKVIDTYKSKLDNISSVDYCTNKNSIILGGMSEDSKINTNIEFFSIIENKTVKIYKTMANVVDNLSCSPDGKYIAYNSGWDFKFCLLDMETGKLNNSLVNDDGKLYKFSSVNKMIAYEHSKGKITVWDYSKNKSKCYLNCGNTNIEAITFSPNDRLLAVGCSDNYIQIWDLDNQIIKVTLTGYENISSNCSLTFSPDGKLLISSDSNNVLEDKRLVIWSIEDTILMPNKTQSNLKEIHNDTQLNNRSLPNNTQKNYTNKKISIKEFIQWFNRLALFLVIFWGLALLAYNKISNTIIKYILVILLIGAGISSFIDSIKELQEMNKKNNC